MRRPPQLDTKVIPGSDGEKLLLDTRYFPIVFGVFDGPLTEKIVDEYYGWRKPVTAYAASLGQKIIMVIDADKAGIPKPTVRKKTSEYAAGDKDDPGFDISIFIVNNPLMRGALTAMIWVMGTEKAQAGWAANYADAAAKAVERLGQPTNLDPSTYKFNDS